MPFVGLGLHFLVAIYFAIHAVRSGQQTYWLFILFSFPLLGSIVYFFAIYLPDSRVERGARKVVARAAKAMDPTRELREARAEYAIWAILNGERELATRLHAEIQQAMARWNRHTRELNQATLQRLQAAAAAAGRESA